MKNIKKKRIFLIFLLLLMLFLIGGSVFAYRELEIQYPSLPGVETPTTIKTALPDYLKYIFTFLIMTSGILAFGAIVFGGIKYLISAGAPAAMSDARDQITSGILGVIIILVSFLILNTINPQLVLPRQPSLVSAIAGIRIYSNSNDCGANKIIPDQEINSMIINQTIKKLKDPSHGLDWGNSGTSGTSGTYKIESMKFYSKPEDLAVKIHEGEDLGGSFRCYGKADNCSGAITPIVEYEQGDCKDFVSTNLHQSIKLDWYVPGVYLYADNDCQGNSDFPDPQIYQLSSATLPGFDNQTRSIKFISGELTTLTPPLGPPLEKYQLRYSAVLHKDENFLGDASIFDINRVGENQCFRINGNTPYIAYPNQPDMEGKVSSITVYLKPKYKADGTEKITGPGASFYENKNYEMYDNDANCNTAKVSVPAFGDGQTIGRISHTNTLKYCTNNCNSECNDKFTSMKMDGDFIALLCDENNFSGKCQVFTASDSNFRDDIIGQCGYLSRGDCLSSFIIRARR